MLTKLVEIINLSNNLTHKIVEHQFVLDLVKEAYQKRFSFGNNMSWASRACEGRCYRRNQSHSPILK